MNIESKIWKMIDGEIIEVMVKDQVFVLVKDEPFKLYPKVKLPPQKKYKHNVKISYLEKWMQTIPYDVFSLEQFYKAYPKQKKNKKLDSNIGRLIAEKKIIQLGKTKFKVIT